MEKEHQIFFYEWSDINSQPIEFKCNNDFLNFCSKSNIRISKSNYNFIDFNKMIFATCKIGKNELIMSGDYRNFRKNFSRHKNVNG